jgi:hypothetical protein
MEDEDGGSSEEDYSRSLYCDTTDLLLLGSACIFTPTQSPILFQSHPGSGQRQRQSPVKVLLVLTLPLEEKEPLSPLLPSIWKDYFLFLCRLWLELFEMASLKEPYYSQK